MRALPSAASASLALREAGAPPPTLGSMCAGAAQLAIWQRSEGEVGGGLPQKIITLVRQWQSQCGDARKHSCKSCVASWARHMYNRILRSSLLLCFGSSLLHPFAH